MPSSVDEFFLLLLNPYFCSEMVAGPCLNKYYQEFDFILLITLELMVNVSYHDDKPYTAQKMKCSIKYFFSKFDQIRSFLWIWSHLLKKSLMENFIFGAVLMWEHRYEKNQGIFQNRNTKCLLSHKRYEVRVQSILIIFKGCLYDSNL